MRMQGNDKGLAVFRGKPLVEHVLDIVTPQVDDIVISANRNLSRYQAYGVPVIRDAFDGFAGPLAGIASALPACKYEWVLVTPCDMPYLPRDLVLILHAGHNTGPLVVAEADGRLQLVFLMRRESLDSINAFLRSGRHRVMAWLQSQPYRRIRFSSMPDAFSNFNSLADFDS